MQITDVAEKLELSVLAGGDYMVNEVTGGYVTDLLSCVIAGANVGNVWITLQTHVNIVAVASLKELAGIIVAEGAVVPEITLKKAEQQGMVILSSSVPIYETVKRLAALGI